MIFRGREMETVKLLGKGKGGYSYLSVYEGKTCVLKQFHDEKVDYYSFSEPKLSLELRDYDRLWKLGLPLPELYDYDSERGLLVKEYIDGPTCHELVRDDLMTESLIEQVRDMCRLLYPAGLNIDYYPTNFIPSSGRLYYIDYECNPYDEKWDFEHWGIKYWSKTEEFLKTLS
ncbi:MAG: hypothetical protein ACI4NM_05275 [Bullifex sp.]